MLGRGSQVDEAAYGRSYRQALAAALLPGAATLAVVVDSRKDIERGFVLQFSGRPF